MQSKSVNPSGWLYGECLFTHCHVSVFFQPKNHLMAVSVCMEMPNCRHDAGEQTFHMEHIYIYITSVLVLVGVIVGKHAVSFRVVEPCLFSRSCFTLSVCWPCPPETHFLAACAILDNFCFTEIATHYKLSFLKSIKIGGESACWKT